MGRKKAKDQEALKHRLFTRVNEAKYRELQNLLKQNPQNDMSSLLRSILYQRPVIIYTKDQTIDLLLDELTAQRAEIKAIGININQITRYFNTYPEDERKRFYAKIGLARFIQMQGKVDTLLTLISKLSKRWLSESKQGKE